MKNMRKIASVLLALVMVFALAAPVFAAETYSITINNSTEGYTYEAYQIFTGDLSKASENDAVAGTTAVLSNIQWGTGVANAEDLGDAATVAESLSKGTLTVEDLLAQIELTEVKATSEYANDKYVISGLTPGYYLVKNSAVAAGGAYTEYILEVVENSTLNPKSDVPEFEKKVQDTNDSTGDTSDWQDSADYDIGDQVPFQLKATLADNVTAYDEYKVVFHDKLSAGLTFNAGSVEVYVDGEKVTTGYTLVTNPDDDCTFEVVINDAKEIGAGNSSVIIVKYTAQLNTNAEVGYMGNPNYAHLEYSNNPNWDSEGGNEPGTPGGEEPPTGETPEDKVIVFTYKFVVNKVDEQKNPLAGATFELYKKVAGANPEWVLVDKLVVTDGTTFTWTGLDDGEYKLVETVTPAGYNTIAPIEFTIEANHNTTWETEDRTEILIDLTGNKYTGDVESGAYETQVENKSGVELPETGGIGTTIFYTMGAMLALGAAVLLITKKRMGVAE